MTHAICHVSASPIRKFPDDTSEMVSQVLFGEVVRIVSRKGKNWARIECTWDGYIGWLDPKQVTLLLPKEAESLLQDVSYTVDTSSGITSDDTAFPITLGSSLPNFDGLSFNILDQKFFYNGSVLNKRTEFNTVILEKLMKRYLHAPYLWGGRSPFGIDCSGFTQVVYKCLGVALPRDAYQQAEYGDIVDFIDTAEIGDLAFFENKEGRIHHVGILLNNKEIIHASGYVRKDRIDHFGIFHKGKRSYTHRLRFVKRLLKPSSQMTERAHTEHN